MVRMSEPRPLFRLLCAGLLLAGAAPATAPMTLSGFGPVRLGMSGSAAQRALGARFTPRSKSESDDCWAPVRADGRDPAVSYMVEHGRVVRIDVGRAAGRRVGAPRTDKGVGLGSTEAAVRHAYAVKIEPHPYDPAGRWLVADHGASAMIFETSAGRVTSFRIGLHPAVDLKEGCG